MQLTACDVRLPGDVALGERCGCARCDPEGVLGSSGRPTQCPSQQGGLLCPACEPLPLPGEMYDGIDRAGLMLSLTPPPALPGGNDR